MANNLERLENCQKRLENCQKMLDDLVKNMKDYHEDLKDWTMALDKHAQEFKEELIKAYRILLPFRNYLNQAVAFEE